MKNLGQRIKMIRQGVARSTFSERFGISPVTLKRYEDGLRDADPAFLEKLISDQNLCRNWLLTGTGPMYREKQKEETADASAVLAAQIPQHAENTNDKKQKTADASAVLDIQRELMEALRQGMEFQKQAMALTQENADIRIAFERAQLENERHLSRIRDLEREAAEIPALKARIAELERELSERPKLPKTVSVDVSAKSKPTPAHGAGTDTAVVPGTSAGVSGMGNLGAVVRNGE